MIRLVVLVFMFMSPSVALAQDDDPLLQYKWLKRPLVIFADSADDPRFIRQMELLQVNPEDLEARDVVILTDVDAASDTDLRNTLHPRDFMLVLIAKDGNIALRKPTPWTVRELSRAIDKMPLRQDELQK